MSSLIALSAALAYGGGDFVAGLMSRRAHFALVALTSQCVAVALATSLAVSSGRPPTGSELALGSLAGIGSAIGLLTLYRGLANGNMGAVGCISAVGAAGFPVLYSAARGEQLSTITTSGMLFGLAGVWLVSRGAGSGSLRAGPARDGLVAGFGFALMFIGLGARTGASSWWPLSISQLLGIAVMALYACVLRTEIRSWPDRPPLRGCVLAGLLTCGGTAGFRLASQSGALSTSALLAGLYPGVTLLLARLFLGERLSRWQTVGLGMSATAVVLITLGA